MLEYARVIKILAKEQFKSACAGGSNGRYAIYGGEYAHDTTALIFEKPIDEVEADINNLQEHFHAKLGEKNMREVASTIPKGFRV